MSGLIHSRLVSTIARSVEDGSITVLNAEDGMMPIPSVQAALAGGERTVVVSDGNWKYGGYLAGLNEIVRVAIDWATENNPVLIERAQQSLKRLFPLMESDSFTVPKDLTNTSTKEERTRFYHHEYQNKLLVGLAEFLIACARDRDDKTVIVIDRASDLSPTVKSAIKLLSRLEDGMKWFRFVLIDNRRALYFPNSSEFFFARYSFEELQPLLSLDQPDHWQRQLYEASRGNPMIAEALVTCDQAGLPVVGYIDPTSIVDLYLASLTVEQRREQVAAFIEEGCKSSSFITQRNYETFDSTFADDLHANAHKTCMDRYLSGDAPLVLLHGLAVRDKERRLELLAEPSEILKSIGLYDTWFSYFGEIFADPDLRSHGSGDYPVNAAFINAAFVLYSLGCGRVSVPYLEEFYSRFPKSKYTPTVLYAQSMTYGRYQLPVDLPLAEEYALRNLATIERDFRDFDKYHYIKVFAENAYAYIKARQGKYDEALRLCTEGNARMLEIYGDNRFKLHQSILIYNTSQVYELVRDLPLAEKQLLEAVAYDPFYGEYQNDLGNLLSKMPGRDNDALQAYARAIEFCPPYYEAHLNRATLRARLGDTTAALADLGRALTIKPEEWRAYLEKGNILMGRGDAVGALDAYLCAERINPRNADLQSNLGLAHSELGSTESSIAHYLSALEIAPRHALTHNNLAIEYFNSGESGLALKHSAIAVDIGGDPDFDSTYEHIQLSLAS